MFALARADVDGARDELLARPRLADEQHGSIRRSDAICDREHLLHRGGSPEQILERVRTRQFELERLVEQPEAQLGRSDHERDVISEPHLAGPEVCNACSVARSEVAQHVPGRLDVDPRV